MTLKNNNIKNFCAKKFYKTLIWNKFKICKLNSMSF